MIGRMAGLCWGSDTEDFNKNYKRGLNCIKANHGRTLEYPQIYIEFEGYSARVIRELYTHIGSLPSRLQESTRYMDFSSFEFVTPPSIQKNSKAEKIYKNCMKEISNVITQLNELGVKREDSAMLLPLAMETKVIMRTNLRHLVDMSHQRLCSRAYWEFRELFKDLMEALSNYSNEWRILIKELKIFKPKCEMLGYCPELKSCGRKEKKEV